MLSGIGELDNMENASECRGEGRGELLTLSEGRGEVRWLSGGRNQLDDAGPLTEGRGEDDFEKISGSSVASPDRGPWTARPSAAVLACSSADFRLEAMVGRGSAGMTGR
mmetsp:Transcript_51096/g.93791  ORF Transcript_51096/g.93791 Transcript_51096/m.93791 type:complete len:109 (+) Transcript_51096:38-364(+)